MLEVWSRTESREDVTTLIASEDVCMTCGMDTEEMAKMLEVGLFKSVDSCGKELAGDVEPSSEGNVMLDVSPVNASSVDDKLGEVS